MLSKCDFEAKEEKDGEIILTRDSQAKCDVRCAHSHSSSGHELSLRQEEKESRTSRMPRAHTDISHLPIISPLSPHFWERGNFTKRFYQAHQRGKEDDPKV